MKRITAAAGIVVLALAGYFVVVQPQAVDMCVQNWEDASGGGDTMSICNTPSNLKVANLGTMTQGLHDGCNRGINQSSTWSDCISSAKVFSLPANYKVVWYASINYANPVYCADGNGTSGILQLTASGVNDVVSSIRVLGGNC